MPETTSPARRFYDRISSFYDALSDAGEHAARDKGLELLDVQPGERVLEIGYGTGRALEAIARAVGDSGRVVGVDISQGMHDVAAARLEAAGLADRVQLDVAEVPPLSYDNAAFDAISMSFTLELFPLDVIPTVLDESKRVLTPAGRLGVVSMAVTPDGGRDSLLEKTYKWMHEHFPHIVDCQPIDVPAFFDRAALRILQRADLEIFTMPVIALVGAKQ